MNSRRMPSMKKQLRVLFASALGLSILATGIIWIVYSRIALEEQAEQMYSTQVEMIASAMKPAMMFNDHKLAGELLSRLQINPEIHSIRFYAADGSILAGFPDQLPPANQTLLPLKKSESIIEGGYLIISRPVMHKDSLVGGIHVEFDLTSLTGRYHADIVNIAAIMLAILTFSMIIYLRLQNRLAESEKNLHDAIQRAEAASRAKSEFLSIMSHELRTPIHGIIGLHQLIGDGADNLTEEQRENLMLAQQSAKSLRALVNDILDLGKIESGNLELNESDFDLLHLICEAMVPFRVTTMKKGLLLSLHIDSAPRRIHADEVRLRQVLLNLVGNAVKFTDSGEVSVHVTTKDDQLLFTISDSGSGIDPEEMEQIFEPFVQGKQSRKLVQKGTGLGTSIAKKLVELMGGSISARSEPGYGSSFTFHIPCNPTAPDTILTHLDSTSGLFMTTKDLTHTEQSDPASSLRILLAEDDPIARRIVVKQLGRAGIEVDIAESGNDAWQKLQDNTYDLLLTDVRMPGISGTELTRRVREREDQNGAPRMAIVGLSAHALEEVARECLNAGMDQFMSKPVDPNTIISAILKNIRQIKDDID